jgi:hypothetical protein
MTAGQEVAAEHHADDKNDPDDREHPRPRLTPTGSCLPSPG